MEVEEYTPRVFDSIQGRLTGLDPTRAVVEAGGIGYEIHVPLSTHEVLSKADGEVRLLVHLVVRENEWRLFGFLSVAERDVFRALLKVNGVGPLMALGLLSCLRPGEFRAAVTQGDIGVLKRVKGIGRKTAERIVIELRDVVSAEPGDELGGEHAATPAAATAVEDATRALVALGMDPTQARRRVETHATDPETTVAELVRAALRG